MTLRIDDVLDPFHDTSAPYIARAARRELANTTTQPLPHSFEPRELAKLAFTCLSNSQPPELLLALSCLSFSLGHRSDGLALLSRMLEASHRSNSARSSGGAPPVRGLVCQAIVEAAFVGLPDSQHEAVCDQLDKVIRAAASDRHRSEADRARLVYGRAAQELGDNNRAIPYYEEVTKHTGVLSGLANIRLAGIHASAKRNDKAKRALDSAFTSLEPLGDQGTTWHDAATAQYLLLTGDHQHSLDACNKVLASSFAHPATLGTTLNIAGICQSTLGDKRAAAISYWHALRHQWNLVAPRHSAMILRNISRAYIASDNSLRAFALVLAFARRIEGTLASAIRTEVDLLFFLVQCDAPEACGDIRRWAAERLTALISSRPDLFTQADKQKAGEARASTRDLPPRWPANKILEEIALAHTALDLMLDRSADSELIARSEPELESAALRSTAVSAEGLVRFLVSVRGHPFKSGDFQFEFRTRRKETQELLTFLVDRDVLERKGARNKTVYSCKPFSDWTLDPITAAKRVSTPRERDQITGDDEYPPFH